jgi:Spy/CpxP family protein refolding chaperone
MKMTSRILGAATVIALLAGCAGGGPYSGQQERAIKALSAREVRDLMAGAGMGFARAAELNSYPGPMHVLELGTALGLSAEQRLRTKRLMDEHKADARAIGAKLVQAERELDALFRSGNVDQKLLAERVRAVASLQGEYRLAHLETHRRMHALLTREQIERYDELRGYR